MQTMHLGLSVQRKTMEIAFRIENKVLQNDFTNNKYETFLTFCNIFPTVDTVIVKQSLRRYKNKSPVRDKNKNKRFYWELSES